MVRADFDRNLKGLQEDLLALGSLVEQAIAKSMQALKSHDLEASREVVATSLLDHDLALEASSAYSIARAGVEIHAVRVLARRQIANGRKLRTQDAT